MKVAASSLRKGNVVDLAGKLYVVLSAQNIHPGKGTPVTQLDMRRISDGVKVSERYRTTEQVERAYVEDREFQYLYQDGDGFHFMNPETYDQIAVSRQVVGEVSKFMLENQMATVATHEGVPLYVELPASVELVVSHTDPGVQGDRATGGTKPATLETGAEINVPLFLNTGDKVKVDTRDGRYLGRVSG